MSLIEKKSRYAPENSIPTYTGYSTLNNVTPKASINLQNTPGYEPSTFLKTVDGKDVKQPSSRYNYENTYLNSIQKENKI